MSHSWDASLYDNRHSFVSKHAEGLVALANPQEGERVLDLGCGTGLLLEALSAKGADVTGLDSSASMVRKAQAAYPGFEIYEGNARHFTFPDPFDLVFTNATLHWIHQADEVARCVARSLVDNGRFVGEFGGEGNCKRMVDALVQAGTELGLSLQAPWYYPSIATYVHVLDGAGFEVIFAELFDRPTKLEDPESGMRDWVHMFGGAFLDGVPDDQQETYLSRVEELTRPFLHRDGYWFADYRRLRFVAIKRPV